MCNIYSITTNQESHPRALPGCFTRYGHDWADRFPAIVDAALRIRRS
jgi:hypothetical protein